jgi:hypothetical protein
MGANPTGNFPITGSKGKTKEEEQAPTELPKSKSRRKSA